MTKPVVDVEIIAHIVGSMNHCAHCQHVIDALGVGEVVHTTDLASYPEEFTRAWSRLTNWVQELSQIYPGKLFFRITDAQSPRAMWHAVTRGVRRYPTFIIDGKDRFYGDDFAQLQQMVAQAVARRHASAEAARSSGSPQNSHSGNSQ